MLAHLGADPNARKPLLLTAACFRRLWETLPPLCRDWVRLAEVVADGGAGEARLSDEWGAVEDRLFALDEQGHGGTAGGPYAALIDLARASWLGRGSPKGNAAWRGERRAQAALVREVFGNPFRPVRVAADVRAWGGGAVAKLAQGIYAEGRWEDLPVLGDVLDEAGCADEALLAHCRGQGPHVRGCHALDAALGLG